MADPAFPDPASRNALRPGCRRCPALARDRERIAWGNGPLDADVVVVGEAPAAGDPDADTWRGGNHTGLAYTSRHSGRRVRALFADLGYEPYYTNAVKCFPRAGGGSAAAGPSEPADAPGGSAADGDADGAGGGGPDESPDCGGPDESPVRVGPDPAGDGPTNREPTAAERRRCAGHLRTELRQVGPDAVVPTGKHATASVLSLAGRELDGFLDAVLEPVACEPLGATVVPILHPSYQDVWVARLGYTAEGVPGRRRGRPGARLSGAEREAWRVGCGERGSEA